jgi:coenzyme F420-reducing hydrogenase alpha subunit
VNGFTRIPSPKALETFRGRLEDALRDVQTIAEIVGSVGGKFPRFERETEYIALATKGEYALYDGDIASSDTGAIPDDRYREVTNEYIVPHSTAKFTKHARDSYMVGALARYNINHALLTPGARKAAKKLGLAAPCHKPYLISVAQLVECFHSIEGGMKLIDVLLDRGPKSEPISVKPKAGKGVGAVEAPRGLLIHEYEYDKNGVCVAADCVIPTNQNHANIQKDMEALAPTILERPEKEIELTLEMLVRAYDPCVSCSTHLLKVRRRS